MSILLLKLCLLWALNLAVKPGFPPPSGTTAADLFRQANAAAAKGNHARCIELLTEALRIDPASAPVYHQRGLSYWHTGDYDRSVADFTAAIRLNPREAIHYNGRAVSYASKGLVDQAIADLDETLRLDPTSSRALHDRGNLLSRKGRQTEAIRDLTESIEKDPNNTASYVDRGWAYSLQGKYDLAIKDYDAALKLRPGDAIAHRNRGVAYHKLGAYAKAKSDWVEAVRLDPKDVPALLNLGWLCASGPDPQQRDGKLALEHALRAVPLAQEPLRSFAAGCVAAAYAEMGQFDKAVEWANKALELADDEEKPAVRSQLDMYRSGRPFRYPDQSGGKG